MIVACAGWPTNQRIHGRVREFTCCLNKEVKNSQGKGIKIPRNQGKNIDWTKNLKIREFTCRDIHVYLVQSAIIHLCRVKFLPAAALQKKDPRGQSVGKSVSSKSREVKISEKRCLIREKSGN